MESTVEEQNEAEVKANYPGREDVLEKEMAEMMRKRSDDTTSAVNALRKAFPEPVLTREQWRECRRAVEAGMQLREAAESFGVEYEAVKKRSLREEWLTEARIVSKAEEIAGKEAERVRNLSRPVPTGEKRAETASQALVESFENHRSGTLLNLARMAGKGISRAMQADLPIENWQDAKIVADIAMKLHNVGQEGVNVNVLVGGDGGFEGPVISLSEECDMDETGDDD